MHPYIEKLNEWLVEKNLIGQPDSIVGNLVVFAAIVALALFIHFVFKGLILKAFTRLAARTKTRFDDMIVEHKLLDRLISIIPAILLAVLLPLAFPEKDFPTLLPLLRKLCAVYVLFVGIRFFYALMDLLHVVFLQKNTGKHKPFKSFIQVVKVVLFVLGLLLTVSIMTGERLNSLLLGLGASTLILTMVFQDMIRGLVAGVQLSINDMLHIGDWITLPKYGADGDVIDVSLTVVKVRNFDNTVTTIPPYVLISESFQNWRAMSDSGGRRIKRSINIDMHSVHFCSEEMLKKFRKIALLKDYIDKKEQELRDYNERHDLDASVWVNGRRQTNLGVFRAYIERYLKQHPSSITTRPAWCASCNRPKRASPSSFTFSAPTCAGSRMKTSSRTCLTTSSPSSRNSA